MSVSSRRGGSGGGGAGSGYDSSGSDQGGSPDSATPARSTSKKMPSEDPQRDEAATPQSSSLSSPGAPPAASGKGAWKDPLFGCFRYGLCHASVCHACCCLPLAVAQVMTRQNLAGWGRPASVTTLSSGAAARSSGGSAAAALTKSVFATILLLVASFWVTRVFLLLIIAILDPNVDSDVWKEPGFWYYFFCAVDDLLALAYFCASVVLLRNVRRTVRSRYGIPEGNKCPAGCEDSCLSVFCGGCVAAQILRQTADYDTVPGVCCSETGLPPMSAASSEVASLIPSQNRSQAGGVVEMV